LKTFAELETRVAALPDEQSRGNAFEVFAEAYLATQRKHDASNVWPLAAVPTKILQTLGLAAKDHGVDGVFKTLLGSFNAYQVKFRTNRRALTWRELSTFMGLADSPQISNRVLFTNCDELPSVLNERKGFFCIRGSDLDRLEAEDFRAIEGWLADVVFVAPRKHPQPHQTEALDALLPALETHDRVSAIMACGTGKTLVALWVAERRHASRILVLLPSLALLRQVLHEWLRESSLTSLAYLCVCSDPTVKDGLDSIATEQSDLDFQVSTNTASVRGFLDAPFFGTKVVFSTYQSARVVGTALKPDEAFDLAVFDEAHKTAGREGRNFAYALEDANLPVRKRLFLTATPRHYNPQKRDGEGDAQLVYSMDRPDVYGPQAYCLTFAEAARRGIICGYKVIISVITSEMVTNELLSRGDVVVNGDAVRACQVANQIALRDAVEKYGARKAFTFHRTVASAASFVADGSEGIRTHIPDFDTFHVNGTMPTARREREMRDFRSATRAVMSNARCLTEGVDVPAVDMVAFLSPRRSRVDIVQATGRAMRRSPGKTTGYVLVPLFVEQAADETVEAAVSRSAFDEVWDVLHSLQEQDDVLAELIRHMGEQKGRGKGFDDSLFADRVDIVGMQIGFEALRSAVATRCFESLFSSWATYYGKLVAFKERFGHCNVEACWEEDSSLGAWVSAQRTRRTKGTLTDQQISQLDGLEFVWKFQAQKAQDTWMKWYRELETYTRENGNPHVPRRHANTKLASWVWIQRQRRNGTYKHNGTADSMKAEQVSLLEKLGFRWDARKGISEERWADHFEQLRRYKEQHGHCRAVLVPSSDSNSNLMSWVTGQRSLLQSGGMDAARKAQLDSLGFSWAGELAERSWEENYGRLEKYQAQHGNADVPDRWKEDRKLGSWVGSQRRRLKQGLISDEQKQQLDKLGFNWQIREKRSWEDRIADVSAFKAKNGHCEIPVSFSKKRQLGSFVNQMRTARKNGTLPAERIAELDALGFVWVSSRKNVVDRDGTSAQWQARFDEFLKYKQTHGDHKGVSLWKEDPLIARWVSQQRQDKNRGKLHPKREEMLNAVAFDWGFIRDLGGVNPKGLWALRYDQLVEFKKQNGHCVVPYKYPDNRQLGIWVANQRSNRKKKKITAERKRLLSEIGFW
jgi:superfamily II DNA or RNA helicase